jgi:acetyltransferase-like isoleucine patch superfamily enzyme
MKKIWVIGSSGFSLDIALKFSRVPGEGNIFRGFIDSRDDALKKLEVEISPQYSSLEFKNSNDFNYLDESNSFLFGIGDPTFKEDFFYKYINNFERMHRFEDTPNIDITASTGRGIYFRCSLSSNVKIGECCFIDSYSVLGHGVVVGNFCHIGVGVIVGGDVFIDKSCNIHSGAVIGNGISIGENSIIGAGAVVVRDLPPNSKVVAPKSMNFIA